MNVTFKAKDLRELFDIDVVQSVMAMGILTADNDATDRARFAVFEAYLNVECGVGHGMESLEYEVNSEAAYESFPSGNYGTVHESHINMGVSYDGTVILTHDGDAIISSWGDRVEALGNMPGVTTNSDDWIPWHDAIDVPELGYIQIQITERLGDGDMVLGVFMDGELFFGGTVGKGVAELDTDDGEMIVSMIRQGYEETAVSQARATLAMLPDGIDSEIGDVLAAVLVYITEMEAELATI